MSPPISKEMIAADKARRTAEPRPKQLLGSPPVFQTPEERAAEEAYWAAESAKEEAQYRLEHNPLVECYHVLRCIPLVLALPFVGLWFLGKAICNHWQWCGIAVLWLALTIWHPLIGLVALLWPLELYFHYRDHPRE